MKYRYHPENIIITSGGTVTPIDKMRVLTNKAAGTTGALLAEEMLQNQQKVTFITTGRSVLPYTHKLQLQPLSCTPEEAKGSIEKLQKEIKSGTLRLLHTPFFQDYLEIMDTIALSSQLGDVAIIAAAVSDYGMKTVVDGKISSSHENLALELEKLPKIIERMREKSPSLTMIGFKLLPAEATKEKSIDILLKASLKQMHGKAKTDLVIANTSAAPIGDNRMRISETILVHPDGNFIEIERKNLSKILLEIMPDLIEKRKSIL